MSRRPAFKSGLDRLIRTKEGELLSHDREENGYIVRAWHCGREYDVRSVTDTSNVQQMRWQNYIKACTWKYRKNM